MNQVVLSLLALTGGIFLAAQGGLNAQLGVLLKNPLMASLVAFCSSATFASIVVAFSVRVFPSPDELRHVPCYLWFTGGLCSLAGISLYYYTIPKLGIATMLSLGLGGQLLFSLVAGHYGWFGLPAQPVDARKLIGLAAMLLGIFLMSSK